MNYSLVEFVLQCKTNGVSSLNLQLYSDRTQLFQHCCFSKRSCQREEMDVCLCTFLLSLFLGFESNSAALLVLFAALALRVYASEAVICIRNVRDRVALLCGDAGFRPFFSSNGFKFS